MYRLRIHFSALSIPTPADLRSPKKHDQRVFIIGGYGNFGRFIARMLAREEDIQVIIAGRSLDKARALASQLGSKNPPEPVALDMTQGLAEALIDGEARDVYGWMNLRFRSFWGLNNRPLGNCNIPDLE